MTAADFASLLNARRAGRGRWTAKCPVHGDQRASLSIAEGKRRPILFSCMSQHCSPESILDAMGLTWQDVLGDRAVTPEIRQRLKDQERLKRLETRWLACSMNTVWDSGNRHYWEVAARKTDGEIDALRCKMDPPGREEQIKAAITKYGWDEIWRRFMETEKRKALSAQWGV